METNPQDYAHIPGWGIDADPHNNPSYPMKHRTNGEHAGYVRPDIPQQPVDIEVLHSNERPNVTAVFGTSAPPKGLSGMIRRFAFKYSENEYAHWLPLILADRVNMVEGLIEDLARGHVPNIFAEKGGKAEWKYNRKGAIQSLAVGALLTAGAVVLLTRKSKTPKSNKIRTNARYKG